MTDPFPRTAPLAGATAYLAVAVALGIVVRALPLAGLEFPLGDGGMFAVMAEDIRSARYLLPAFTSYNGGQIPFVYPPLGIYLVAMLPGDPIITERWLPFVWSLLAILAFWVLARELFDDEAAGVATIAFALLPGAYAWQIMGGGVTRALEQLLVLVALAAIARLLVAPGPRPAIVAAVAAGMAGLAHPFAPIAITVGCVALWLLRSRSSHSVLWLGVVAIGATALVTPWLAAVLSRHGVEPFLATAGTHGAVPDRWLAVVVAVTLGLALTQVALPIAQRVRLRVPVAAALLIVAAVGSVASRWMPGSVIYAVPPEVQQELAMLGRATAPDTTFAVWTGNIGDDHIAEWFPALTDRVSVGTYQGAEWRGDWAQTVATHIAIQECRCPMGADRLWAADE